MSSGKMTQAAGKVLGNGMILDDYIRIYRIWPGDDGHCHCAYCDKTLVINDSDNRARHHNTATIDHIVPKSGYGSSNLDNIVIACYECNIGKGATYWVPKYVCMDIGGFWSKERNPKYTGKF